VSVTHAAGFAASGVGCGVKPGGAADLALVATDERLHWDDLPPGRRQNLNLVVFLGAALVAVGGTSAVVAALVRRRRSRSPR